MQHRFPSGPHLTVSLVFKDSRLTRINLALGCCFSCSWNQETPPTPLIAWLKAYSTKKPLPTTELVDLQELPPFHRLTLDYLQKIPFGETASYGQVAEEIGSPRAARAVGNACNRNPFSLLIPCHRVIAATGKLGGFAIDSRIKERLLTFES